MALTREKKTEVVDEISQLLAESKLTVMAKYSGTSVKSMQSLRRSAKDNGTTIKVVKNRLFKKALEQDERFKNLDFSQITGQLLYAFNGEDEVAPAKDLAEFAKTEPQLEFVAGLSFEGALLPVEDIKSLASLPTKDQLRAQLVGTIGAPISGFASVLGGNVRSILNVFNARAENLG